MTDKQKAIIKEWNKVKTVHPSYGEIAQKIGSPKSYVYRVIAKYLKGLKNP